MNNKLIEFLNNINESDLNRFVGATKSNITANTNIEKVVSDTSWISMIEESIPYLDNIIRNPRRFIVQEENIIPVEKARVVTEETIRHLAQNTRLIQDVKEDGTVIPLKLLNVYREETTDLYENRFIKSLVDNLYEFVNTKLKESDQKSFSKINNKVTFDALNESKNNNIKVNLNFESNYSEDLNEVKDGHPLELRIEHIKDVLSSFLGSQFIKSLSDSQPVRSPIRKTNVILKEQNFIKALDLWEYLEKNAVKPVTSIEKTSLDRSNEVKDLFDLSFFINNESLKLDSNKEKTVSLVNLSYIGKIVNDVVFESNITENEFKKLVNKEFKEATKKRKNQEKSIRNCFKDFLNEFDKKKQKAVALLK
ncbi:MAG: DUF2357 domain-containing protein [Bacilli bacterium]